MTLNLTHFLILSTLLLGVGVITILRKRHPIGILLGVELILAAANLNLVAFDKFGFASAVATPATAPAVGGGQMTVLFVTLIGIAQAAVALALFWKVYHVESCENVEGTEK